MNSPLAEMFRYNRWANYTLLEACRVLDEGQLGARMQGGSGDVLELLLHLVGGEQTFALRTKGRQHEGELDRKSGWPGIDALIDISVATGAELISIAEGLDT